MRSVNEFLATGPFDLYELKLFHLVAAHRSFTRAGQASGLTQSAISRQIQGMETRLGLKLFDRSTRQVRLTPEGAALHARSGAILAEVDDALRALRGRSPLLPQTMRVGVSRTVGLAYLPGFFHAFRRKLPDAQLQVSHQSGDFILGAVESGELDVGILSPPTRLPRALEVALAFDDEFVLILPPRLSARLPNPCGPRELGGLLARQRWLQITRQSFTGQRLQAWLHRAGIRREPDLEADSFDFIINLVSLGLGASLVPHRALALHPGTRPVTRVRTEPRFSRTLSIIARQGQPRSALVSTLVENVLFRGKARRRRH